VTHSLTRRPPLGLGPTMSAPHHALYDWLTDAVRAGVARHVSASLCRRVRMSVADPFGRAARAQRESCRGTRAQDLGADRSMDRRSVDLRRRGRRHAPDPVKAVVERTSGVLVKALLSAHHSQQNNPPSWLRRAPYSLAHFQSLVTTPSFPGQSNLFRLSLC
jgi:hypothetical protein